MARTYDPKGIIIIFGGFTLTGFQDGTFITVDRNEDAFSLQVGADGFDTRNKSNNRSGTVTFTPAQTSPSNDILSAIARQDELSNSGVYPLLIKEVDGTSLFSAEAAWIKKLPTSEFANEAGGREWVIETGQLEVFVGSK